MKPVHKLIIEHGQAALDFLTEYGWAMALVVIVAAVLFALGIFDPSSFISNHASGFSGVAVKGWQMYGDGTFAVRLENQFGKKITIDSVNVSTNFNSSCTVSNLPVALAPGEDSALLTCGSQISGVSLGSDYAAKVDVGYTDAEIGFPYSTTGKLMGKAVGMPTGGMMAPLPPSCSANLQDCSSNTCCSGLLCISKFCCADIGTSCASNSDCCSSLCDANTHVCRAAPSCTSAGQSCTATSQCCAASPYCTGATPSTACSASCGNAGAYCTSTSDCCTGTCDITLNTCRTGGPHANPIQ